MEKEEELVRRVGAADEEEVMNINKRRLAVLKQGTPFAIHRTLPKKTEKRTIDP